MICATLLALGCLMAVSEARPQAPAAPQVVDIAAAYEQYHQLWLAEAQRNSVAPVSLFKKPTSAKSGTEQPAVESAPVAEVQVAPEPAVVEPELKQAADPEPVAAVVEVAADVPAEPAAVPDATLLADMNTAYAEFHRLWLAEAARNAIAPTLVSQQVVQEEQQPQVAQEQAAQQAAPQEEPVVEPVAVMVEEPVAVMVEEPVAVLSEVPVDHEAEAAKFHALWQQEAARNAIPPQVGAQPVLVPTEVIAEPQQTIVEVPAPASPEINLVSPVTSPSNPWGNNFPIVVFFQPTV